MSSLRSHESGPAPSPAQQRAAEWLRRVAGLALPEHRWPSLQAVLARLDPSGNVDAALDRVAAGDARARRAVLAAVTVPETYLFRHPAHFEALAEHARAAARCDVARVYRVLSAGCATGEEAWSAAAVLDAVARQTGLRWQVQGWDLDADRIARARAGRYSAWSARRGLAGYDDAFLPCERGFAVHPRLRAGVCFESTTLAPAPAVGSPVFDAVFLRNVAIYWAPECAATMLDAVAGLVGSEGLLLLGASEPECLARGEWQLEWRGFVRVATRRPSLPATDERASVPSLGPDTLRASVLSDARRAAALRTAKSRRRAAEHAGKTSSRAAFRAATERERAVVGEAELLAEIRSLADRGRYLDALARLDELPARDHAEPHLWRSIVCSNLGRHDDALAALRRAVFLAPDDANCRRWLALALAACGRELAAGRELRNAEELQA